MDPFTLNMLKCAQDIKHKSMQMHCLFHCAQEIFITACTYILDAPKSHPLLTDYDEWDIGPIMKIYDLIFS